MLAVALDVILAELDNSLHIRTWLPLVGLLLLSILFGGCDLSSIWIGEREYKVTLQTEEGKYVSADEFKQQQLFADRNSVKEWEVFTLVELPDDQVALKSSFDRFVSIDTIGGNILVARDKELEPSGRFNRIDIGSRMVVLQTYRGGYLTVNDQQLVADGARSEEAIKFKISKYDQPAGRIFRDHQLFYLLSGLLLVFLSIVSFQLVDHKRWAVGLLFIGGILVRVFMVELSDYLHWWDEQFHALVAKNMMDDPFRPMLFPHPVLPYEPLSWVAGHIWLHKQPLFLWQMALSMKLFGVSTTAMRLPSLIMSALVIPMIYRMGKIGFGQNVGYYGALLYTLSFFGLRLTSGAIHTDHNDMAFLFYVAASFWAWFEYENASIKDKWKWTLLVGLFAGGAVLNKWLTGLLVFAVWGIINLAISDRRSSMKTHLHLVLSVLVAVAVFLPWQLYILSEFPELSSHEYSYNSKHFFDSVEGHGEDLAFHFVKVEDLYGVGWPILILCFVLFWWKRRRSVFTLMVGISIVIIYGFFTIAVTKMIAFTYCIAFLVFLVLGYTVDRILDWIVVNPTIPRRRLATIIFHIVLLSGLSYFNFNLDGIEEELTMKGKDSTSFIHIRRNRTGLFKRLPELVPDAEKTVLFNCKPDDAVQIMFFTDFMDAHTGFPTYEQYLSIKQRGIPIAYFDAPSAPDYLKTDISVSVISENYH
ncbi:MAG: glycosyltransferase family 39 protein [Flavobacteriales bacterium]|nr:glycosyltransferase family 39 protein [Flavobacteriales bacterium]